ncbi:dienelactone hydrolase family protein [Consotaella aegiceratis]|uniref:dienelactone hydrolase family protein n=1 Tax=Consotaella aegiceratis TaxID=3097961 RepID=UPI002F3F2198
MVRRVAWTGAMAMALVLLGNAANAQGYETKPITEGNLPAFYEALKAKMTFPLSYEATGGELQAWHDKALAKAEEIILPTEDATPYQPEVIDEIDRGTYVARRVVFNVTAESRVLGLELVPKGEGPFPAVLMLHDHGSKFDIGKEKFIEPWYDDARLESAQAWADKFFTGRFPGDVLAERGYVVFATDALGWGDREGNGYEAQQALASNMFGLGSSLAGLVALEDKRVAEFLAEQPEVDSDRLAVVGFSMGAFRAWQVAALSDAVKAAVVDCWMVSMPGLMVPGNNTLRGQSAFYLSHPMLGRYLDFPDVASLAAPKPMLFFDGEDDPLFPTASVEAAFGKMKGVWKTYGAEDKIQTRLWPGLGHTFVAEMQDAAFDWLDDKMKK